MGPARLLLVVDPTAPVEPVVRAAARVAPAPSHLHVVALVPEATDVPTSRRATEGQLATLERLLRSHDGAPLELTFETCFEPSRLDDLARHHHADLAVVGPWPTRTARARAMALVELTAPHGVDVLSVGPGCEATATASGHVALSIDVATRTLPRAAGTVRGLPEVTNVAVFVRGAAPPELEELEPTVRALLPALRVEVAPLPSSLGTAAEALEAAARARDVELLVVATDELWSLTRLVAGLFSAQVLEAAARPVLILHGGADAGLLPERLTATDTLARPGRPLPVRLERTTALGRTADAPDAQYLLLGAEARGPLTAQAGVLHVPPDWVPAEATGLAFAAVGAPGLVARTRVVTAPRLVLVDASLPLDALPDVEPFARDHAIVFVRLRDAEPLESVHARLDPAVPWGGPVHLLDASAWLDDAGAGDVPAAVDGLRLLRLGLHLVAGGVPVGALVTAGGPSPASAALRCWTPEALRRRSPRVRLSRAPARVRDAEGRWRLLTGASLVRGHRVTLGLDNAAERRRLLSAIDAARERVHWQSYIVNDDPLAESFGEALRRAAARGVQVRVLVDALYSLHDAFGTKNPVLERLAAAPGVEVRGARPLAGLPSLVDLKQRNHRKAVVIDGRAATVTGRNLGAPYYRGFDEVALTPASDFWDAPWLDAGVALEGPLVAAVERAFLADWERAGGAAFEVPEVPPAGEAACRLVVHDGLRDAATLEAQLELVHGARQRLVLVNTFPLVLELQRALLAALRRGVAVQLLFGSVRPRWGEGHPFSGGAYRELGDELVRARLDPVLRAGAQGFEYSLPHPTLGHLFPHVHAKLYARDETLVAVGSANLDVTSAYWESEALLLVHDAAFARETMAALGGLLATSRLVDPTASRWTKDAERRAWLGRNWPTLVG